MPSTDDIATRKRQLRRQFLPVRQAIAPEDWRDRSLRLCRHLETLSAFREARSLLAFVSFRGEPDLSPLYDRDATAGTNIDTERTWGFPRCVGRELAWHHRPIGKDWVSGAYGIQEPVADWPTVDLDRVDVVLVPAVAMDRQGGRLGYGGGFYDRTLGRDELSRVVTIGIVFDDAYCEELPREPWDRSLDFICTESGIYPASP